jgi:hypothetical protein
LLSFESGVPSSQTIQGEVAWPGVIVPDATRGFSASARGSLLSVQACSWARSVMHPAWVSSTPLPPLPPTATHSIPPSAVPP